jgi:hypothetical protein
MWHLVIQCGEKGFVCWSVGRHLLDRSVWRDTWDCTVDTETFPLSLWWEFHSEMWSEKTYRKIVWSKTVICGIQVSCDVTCWHSSTTSTPVDTAAQPAHLLTQQHNQHTSILTSQHCQLKSCRLFEIVPAFYSIYFLYDCILCRTTVCHSRCAATR